LERQVITLASLALTLTVFVSGSAGAQEEFSATHNHSSHPTYFEWQEMPHCCAPYWWGTASADRGALRVEGHMVQNSSFHVPGNIFGARYKIYDVVFGAPAGVSSTSVMVYATLSGAEYSGTSPNAPTSAWSIVHDVSVTLNDIQHGSAGRSSHPSWLPPFTSGLLAGYSMQGSFDIVAGPFIVPTNTPVTFVMEARNTPNAISGGACWSRFGLFLGQGAGDFGGPIDVFGLEPGITANAVSAGIVDNQYTPASEVGFRFCQPLVQNSSSVDAVITATGSAEVALNDLTLVVSGLPLAGTTAMLINSMNAWAGVNNPASGGVASDGRICIGGGTFGRHWQHIYSGTAGTFSAPLNLNALPHPSPSGSYALPALAGETWYWQCWYRDQSLGAGRSNFSTALGVLFE